MHTPSAPAFYNGTWFQLYSYLSDHAVLISYHHCSLFWHLKNMEFLGVFPCSCLLLKLQILLRQSHLKPWPQTTSQWYVQLSHYSWPLNQLFLLYAEHLHLDIPEDFQTRACLKWNDSSGLWISSLLLSQCFQCCWITFPNFQVINLEIVLDLSLFHTHNQLLSAVVS